MFYTKNYKVFCVGILLIVGILIGCEEKEEVEEELVTLEFLELGSVLSDRKFTVETKSRIFIWTAYETDFIKTNDKVNRISYKQKDDGSTTDQKIHLRIR